MRIADEQGRDVTRGARGEIVVRGPIVMTGYWRRPEETTQSRIDGWHRTGDLGVMDDEGNVSLVGRLKELYISGGENVYPAEVEDVLMRMPQIADAGVIGIPDEKWGETGLAVVVAAPGETVTEDEVIAYCRDKLAGYKRPRKVQFIEALPRTLTGKILKKDLRALYGG